MFANSSSIWPLGIHMKQYLVLAFNQGTLLWLVKCPYFFLDKQATHFLLDRLLIKPLSMRDTLGLNNGPSNNNMINPLPLEIIFIIMWANGWGKLSSSLVAIL
ncbi:hypothetical protein ACJX0J_036148, partial [Zea mays]